MFLCYRQANDEFQILANSYWYSAERGSALYMAMVDYDDAMDAFHSVSVPEGLFTYYANFQKTMFKN